MTKDFLESSGEEERRDMEDEKHPADVIELPEAIEAIQAEVHQLRQPNEIETTEKILTRDEIIAAIGLYVENFSLQRELSDKDDIYLLEVTIPGENPGETIEYTYQRKGTFGPNSTTTTNISVAYYENGEPVGGKVFANYNEETGEWK